MTPQWCAIARKLCTCRDRCEHEVDDWERAMFCTCDKGDLTAKEREQRKCQACGRQL